MSYFWTGLGALVVLGGLAYRFRLHERIRSDVTPLSDAQIRSIEERGRLELESDEPLDLEEIERAEEEFWEESWDEPDEW